VRFFALFNQMEKKIMPDKYANLKEALAKITAAVLIAQHEIHELELADETPAKSPAPANLELHQQPHRDWAR